MTPLPVNLFTCETFQTGVFGTFDISPSFVATVPTCLLESNSELMRSNVKYICLCTIFGALEGSVRITDEYLKLVRWLGEEVMS